jgi:hypothetical protein
VSWTGEAEESGSGAAIGGEDGAPTPGCRSLYSASQMNSLDPFLKRQLLSVNRIFLPPQTALPSFVVTASSV